MPSEVQTLRDARSAYFARSGFAPDGGYGARWVKLQAGPIPLYFPNSQARVRAVRFHDLHHVLTDYPTTWSGEAQIGAWEVASGCGRHYPAWILNLQAMAIGLVLCPRPLFQAFVRGRHSRNLYSRVFGEDLLETTVGQLRRELQLDAPVPAAASRDRWSFVWWSGVAVAFLLGPWLVGLALAAILLQATFF